MLYNILLTAVIGLYGGVAVIAFLATATERQSARVRRLWPRLLSAAACLAWPLVVGTMVLWPKNPNNR